jgi:hypothetical protein
MRCSRTEQPRPALPKDLLPNSMFGDYLDVWKRDGTVERIHQVL